MIAIDGPRERLRDDALSAAAVFAQQQTELLGLHDARGAFGEAVLDEGVDHISGEPLLVGEAVRDGVHETGDAAKAMQPSARYVGDVGDAAKRHQVMGTDAVHRDAADKHQVVAVVGEAVAEHLGEVLPISAEQSLFPKRPHARRRLGHVGLVVDAAGPDHGAHGLLEGRPVERASWLDPDAMSVLVRVGHFATVPNRGTDDMKERRRSARADGGMDGALERALAELPVFPLPGTVFFPHTLLPLHVFEPRYRQLTEHVLAGHQHVAVVAVDDSRRDAAVPGVARVAGVGRVVHSEKLPDGRFHILLQGVDRAELVEELPMEGMLYRRVKARSLTDTDCDDDDRRGEALIESEVRTLRSCYARLLEVCPDTKDTLGDLPLKVQEPRVLADVVCAAILEDAAARQMALEESSVARRLKLANDALATLLLQSITTETAGMH